MDGLFTSTARRPRRVWVPLALVGAAVLLAAVVALVALAVAERGRLPANAVVGGVGVGSRTPAEARRLVQAAAERRLNEPILLTAAGVELETSGRELGARPDVERALRRADDAGLLDRLRARLGLGEPVRVPVRFRLDPDALADVQRRLAVLLDREPSSARLRLPGLQVHVVPSEEGRRVDRRRLARALARLPATAGVPLVTVDAEVPTAAAVRAARIVESLLAQPRRIRAGRVEAVLRPTQLRRALRLEPAPGRLVVSLAPASLARSLRPRLRRLEVPPRDAAFVVAGKRVRVRPSRPGRLLDLERVAASLVRNRSSLVHRARFASAPPALTTEEAEKLRITELVSEFTTYYACCQPRVTNIQRAAELLDGTVVEPRESFSLNEALGKRTEENGFVAAPQIFNGRLEDAVGGGISQVATTLFNAAFFAGVDLVAHQAHQFYISRYPMGREATVSWGGPELIFRNDWPAAILIKVSAWDTGITVRFYSSRLGRRVETQTGEPYAYRAPETIRISNPALPPGTTSVVQSAGASGFTVQYTRKVYRGEKLIKDERYTVRYDAQNAIVEIGPPKPKPKPKEKPQAGAAGAAPKKPAPGTPPADGGAQPAPGSPS